MEQYISKSALVAEIKRLLVFYSKEIEDNKEDPWAMDIAKRDLLQEILSFLDSIEVKDVDLEKHLKEDIEDVLFDLNGVAVKGATHYLTVEDVKDIAKYFFELGMSVNNKEQKGE